MTKEAPKSTTTPRIFEWNIEYTTEVPDIKPAANRLTANRLPFAEQWFDKAFEKVRADVLAHAADPANTDKPKAAQFFVPLAFWTLPTEQGGRGINTKETTVDGAYMKGKVRDAFAKWRDSTKVVLTPAVMSPTVRDPIDPKKVLKVAKEITPEVAYNAERGGFAITSMERTGKEAGYKEPGLSVWLSYDIKRAADAIKNQPKAPPAA